MPITYDLDMAHPLYRIQIPPILDALKAKYPDARLERVSMFWKDIDYSLANTEADGNMRLNAYWFRQDPEFLIECSKLAKGWHCCLGVEPRRVLTHEFGHAVRMARPHVMQFAEPMWQAATRVPSKASSGYALIDADEFWAEEFAAYELGALDGQRATVMREVLSAW